MLSESSHCCMSFTKSSKTLSGCDPWEKFISNQTVGPFFYLLSAVQVHKTNIWRWKNRNKEKLKVNNLNRGRNICKLSLKERDRERERKREDTEVFWGGFGVFFFFFIIKHQHLVTFWFRAKSNNLGTALQRALKPFDLTLSFVESKGFVLLNILSLSPQLEALCCKGKTHVVN